MAGGLILPLARDPSSRFLPWITGFMVFLAALALAAAMAVSNASSDWRRGLTGTLTVQVLPIAAETDPRALDARVAAAVALVRNAPGVARAEALPPDRMAAMLAPWLGDGAVIADLPLPRLIDVELAGGAPFDSAALARRLAESVPGTSVDDHGVWLRRFAAFARAIEVTAAIVVALISTAAIAVVVFATRSGLVVHRDAIEILHLIGARDGFIARQFQLHAMALGFKGGVLGLVLAGATLALLFHFAQRIDAALLPALGLGAVQWTALALLPVAAAAIGMATARRTVMRALRRMT
jgi:cell division transport system permease protein